MFTQRKVQSSPTRRQILIADDQPLVRRGLKAVIDAEPDRRDLPGRPGPNAVDLGDSPIRKLGRNPDAGDGRLDHFDQSPRTLLVVVEMFFPQAKQR